MRFRKATIHDSETIWRMMQTAIRRLGEAGVDQWQHGYPNPACIAQDIADGVGYVIEEHDHVVCYGAVIFTGEPAYRQIDGAWLTTEERYVVVHRMCVDERVLRLGYGIRFMEEVEALARGQAISFRCDTHADNRIMQQLLPKLGFTRCGVIYFESRYLVAFEKLLA